MPRTQDTPLIVPMAVDAFLFTGGGNETPGMDRRATSLDRLIDHAPMGLALDPEEPEADDDNMGIYLQWELPTALRTGLGVPLPVTGGLAPVQTGEFPLIPNRWLVIRRAFATTETVKQQTLHWLIRADTPVPDDNGGPGGGRSETTPAAVLPGPPGEDTGTYPTQAEYGVAYPITVGSTIPAEPHPWQGTGDPLFLTANSTGLPEFSSYQPYHQNILSFHDQFTDLTATQQALGAGKRELTVSYLVVGWYSHQTSDALNPGTAKLRDTLTEFGWELPGTEDPTVTGTVYAGTVLGVPWKEDLDPGRYQPLIAGPDPFSLDARPDPAQVGMTIGQSSMEACAAAVTRSNLLTPEEARLFSAFQHHLLDAPANPGLPDHTDEADVFQHALQYGEHACAFVAAAGGHRWRLIDPSTTPLTTEQETAAARIRQKLVPLNEAQTQYEVSDGQCRDLLTTLKGLWWISMYYTDDGPQEADAAAVTALQKELTQRVTGRQNLLAKLNTLAAGIRKDLATGKLPHQLQPTPGAPFLRAANPAVVLRNLRACRRTTDPDGYLGGPLPVRRPPAPTGPPLPVYDMLKPLLTPPALACVTPLAQEFDALVDKVIQGVGNRNINCASVRGSTGTGLLAGAPATDPYTRWWNQPWKPAFLEWAADLYPSHLSKSTQSAAHPYTLGTENPTPTAFSPPTPIPQYFHDTSPAGGAPRRIPEPAVRCLSYFATAHPLLEDHTRYRLLHAASLAPTKAARDAYVALDRKISEHTWNLISATLTGVNEACAGRRPDSPLPTRSAALPRTAHDDLTYAPPPPTQTEKTWFSTPDPAVVTARTPHLPLSKTYYTATRKADEKALGDEYFPPVRSGQLHVQKLVVHDAFGRLLDLDLCKLQVAEPLFVSDDAKNDTRTYTVRGDDDPIGGTGLVDLRPRLHQGARLLFDYLTTGPHPQPVSTLPDPDAANPVLGWLMATQAGNRHSLLCHAPDGTPLYDLHCLGAATAATARPLPGCPYTADPLTDVRFPQEHPDLFAFLKPLLKHSGAQGHLAALLSSLDQGLAQTAPPSVPGPDSHGLALMIGRPVALARARLRLELDAPPLRPPTIEALRHASYEPHDTPPWPVALGSAHLHTDGLLGYFTDPGFSVFHTPYPADTGVEEQPRYTRKAEPTDITVTPQQPGTQPVGTDITLLVCPHASTYATLDILPTTALTLSAATLDAVLANIRPVIPVGPLLTPPLRPDARVLRTPTPSLGTDTPAWTLAELTDATATTWTHTDTAPPRPADQSPAPVTHARSGYLTQAPNTQEPTHS
ncbi:hypothetical protein OG413_25230 [Streptomyces sp. NBC_01433]|uniref:hypothetical protein n=1 Tax=Streptomyces sp. NBC_01433 TaxID=2903864 RepID=UPI002251C125|nr:hypothetical protein [Streptomyces sp. NBC_01433]MCX4678570.1 hypothetical protein [Streptomyces sp. NBC_01433]